MQRSAVSLFVLIVGFCGCFAKGGALPAASMPADDAGASIDPPIDAPADAGTEPADPPPTITHAFGKLELPPNEDNDTRCAQWSVGNEQPLYVQAVTLSNRGAFHHSNWFVVDESEFAGADGYFDCSDRNFDQFRAASRGLVLFAQSTQSYVESQRLAPGAVLKLPPRAKVISSIHTLNASSVPIETELFMTLELIHPREVTTVVTAASMQYHDLAIPPAARSRFSSECDFRLPYRIATGSDEVALTVHYILPHYHYLGDYFEVQVVGGERDGETIYLLHELNGEPNGKTFNPPLSLPGATGFRFTCGFNNWRNQTIEWGNGEGEMCVALILIDSEAQLGGTVQLGSRHVESNNGIEYFEGPCLAGAYPKRDHQSLPSESEISGELYLPPREPGDIGVPPVPPCVDADESVLAEGPVTLEDIQRTVFEPSCSFSACHGRSGAGGLVLSGPDLHERLLNRLVVPGDAPASWLYQKMARCAPRLPDGTTSTHMPLNAPFLLDDRVIAAVRTWIEGGAPLR